MTIGISQMTEYHYMTPVLKLLSYLPTQRFIGILQECRKMFGCDPPVLKAIRWDTRTMLRELKVPVILIIDGKDPWTPTCHEKSD